MVLSIHFLRGIAALFVVLYHLRFSISGVYAQQNLGDLLFDYGYFGVDLFFMISGFVIVLSTKSDRSVISFTLKRFFRIYPLYLFTVLFAWFFITNKFTDYDLLKSLLFIHSNYSEMPPFYGYSMVTAAWTLSYEIVFYGLFLLAMSASHKYRSLVCSIFIITLYFSLNLYFHNESMYTAYSTVNVSGLLTPLAKIASSQMMIEFVVGMIMCEIYLIASKKNAFRFVRFNPLLALLASFGVVLVISPPAYGHGLERVGIGCFLILTSLLTYELINRLKPVRFITFFGDISYSLYLTHLVVYNLIYDNIIYLPYIEKLTGFSKMLFLLLIFIAIAFVVHKLIEIPSAKIARIILNKNKAASR